MADLEGTSISGLTTRAKASVADLTAAWFPYEDLSGDPVDTFKMSIDDLLSGTGGATPDPITYAETALPAITDAVGLHSVQTGTSRGLYMNTGTEIIILTPYSIDGDWPVS